MPPDNPPQPDAGGTPRLGADLYKIHTPAVNLSLASESWGVKFFTRHYHRNVKATLAMRGTRLPARGMLDWLPGPGMGQEPADRARALSRDAQQRASWLGPASSAFTLIRLVPERQRCSPWDGTSETSHCGNLVL